MVKTGTEFANKSETPGNPYQCETHFSIKMKKDKKLMKLFLLKVQNLCYKREIFHFGASLSATSI
ncbi:hypothetical protein lpa_01463 [Legionella pneumophila 2300/99 Alcoy]|nr:hypothetical protein lpa_01463 [Legionella pneumophila 2300/99 Alcoy]ANH12399.1 hypothetical protein A5478_04950 [Legionella pneumophila]ANH15366.1 hypothetical protein A5480_04945 [Legionella pneumophila]ANH18332.1 hypothetical protein A5479_04945 [Legionella pneumophila]APX19216.1 hypothetical protein A1D14_04945 [Legionella pneumophila]